MLYRWTGVCVKPLRISSQPAGITSAVIVGADILHGLLPVIVSNR